MSQRKVVISLLSLVVFLLSSVTFAANLERTIKSYDKYVTKVEKNLDKAEKAKNIKFHLTRTEKDLKSLDKRYEKMDEMTKSDAEIKKLREKHLLLAEKYKELSLMGENQNVVKPYERKITTMKKKFVGGDDKLQFYQQFADELAQLQRIYDNIPEEKKSLDIIKNLKKEHDNLIVTQKDMQDKFLKSVEDSRKKSGLAGEFRKTIQNLPFALLVAGKEDKKVSIHDAKRLDKYMDKFAQFEIDCDGKFAEIIKSDDESAGYKASEVKELAKNRKKYKDNVTYKAYIRYINEEIAHNKMIIDDFKKDGYINTKYLNLFLYQYKTYYNNVKNDVYAAIKTTGKKQPDDIYKKLNNQNSEFIAVLNSTYVKKKWKKPEFKDVSGAIKKKAVEAAKTINGKLIDLGYVQSGWSIIKNALGVPLRKYREGYILVKLDKEKFYRQYYAHFYREYDGSKYQDATAVQFVKTVTPLKK